MDLHDEFLHILESNAAGISNDKLKEHFGDRFTSLVNVINDFLKMNRIQLFQQGDALFYRLVKEEIAVKFAGLGPEQMLVYQVCEKAGNRGIWTRDIKNATNMPQHTLTKTLKLLEQRNLVKAVRSVTSKSKKLYMLFDVVPAKELTGGPWYTDQEFDAEFVEELKKFIVQLVRSQGMIALQNISERVRVSGISRIELSMEEIELVVQTLVYDNRLEEVKSSVVAMTGQSRVSKMYKSANPIRVQGLLTSSPCGVCPVIEQCYEGGIISPSTCQYMTQWLNMNTDELF